MSKSEIKIRELKDTDVSVAAELMLRLKKLNGEFDSIFNVSDGAKTEAEQILREALKDKARHIAYVSERGGKVVGLIVINLIHRCYYEPEMEARIVDFYIMPEGRRTGAGKGLVDMAYKELKARNVKLITAEFPALNPIAMKFYKGLGFREIVGIYGKMLE